MNIGKKLAPVLASLVVSCAPATQGKPAQNPRNAAEVDALVRGCSHNINDIVHAETQTVASKIPGDGKLYSIPGRKLTENDPEIKIQNLCNLGFEYKERIKALQQEVKKRLKTTSQQAYNDSDEGVREIRIIAKINHALTVYNEAYTIIEKAVSENRPLPEQRLAIIKRVVKEV